MRIILGIVLIISFSAFGQGRNNTDSLELFSSIDNKLKEINSDTNVKSLVIKDNNGNAILIWKEQNKYHALQANYRSSHKSFKGKRISNKNRKRLNHIFHKQEAIIQVKLRDCIENAYSITRVWLNFNDQGFNFSFDTNCRQEEVVKPLYALYFDLVRK